MARKILAHENVVGYIAVLCTDACNIGRKGAIEPPSHAKDIFRHSNAPVVAQNSFNSNRRAKDRCERIYTVFIRYMLGRFLRYIGSHPHHFEKSPLLQMLGLSIPLRLSQLVILWLSRGCWKKLNGSSFVSLTDTYSCLVPSCELLTNKYCKFIRS